MRRIWPGLENVQAPPAQTLMHFVLWTAARRKQPFLMHKMAFHRARVLSIIECAASQAFTADPQLPGSRRKAGKPQGPVVLSNTLAPPLMPSRAEVFLPYSLPGKPTAFQDKIAFLQRCWQALQWKGETFDACKKCILSSSEQSVEVCLVIEWAASSNASRG